MSSKTSELSGRSMRSRKDAWTHLLAAIVGALPVYAFLIGYNLWNNQPLSFRGFITYLAVISPAAIVIALLVLRVVCGERPRSLNLKSGKASSDLLYAVILSLVIIVANVVSGRLLSELFPGTTANTSVRNLFVELAGNPILLLLFLGLLIPLAAASEEVVRVFLLSRLWKVWPSTTARLVIIVVSACLFGLSHLYRGLSGAALATIIGLIMGAYYLRFGRVLPMIVAHYLTNALQVVLFVVSAP